MSAADLPEGTRETIKKVQRLAESGLGGERETAVRMLDALCKKWKLNPDELLSTEKRKRKLKYYDQRERTLLVQCICHVLQIGSFTSWKAWRAIVLELTTAEEIDVLSCFTYYRKLWKTAKDDLFTSFVSKHEIYSPANDEDPTPMDPERLARLLAMMRGMKQQSWQKPVAALTR